MQVKPLIETNPYLKDADTARKLVVRSVKTSSAVEGIKFNSKAPQITITTRREKKIYRVDK